VGVNKSIALLGLTLALAGCVSNPRGAVPVVDAGAPVSSQEQRLARQSSGYQAPQPSASANTAAAGDSGVVVMVPQGASQAPIQTYPAASSAPITTTPSYSYSPSAPAASAPSYSGGYASSAPSGVPSSSSSSSALSADEQLDGPVLALLTSAQQQQGSGDLNGAASSLERAQRIAPREPQVLYQLAEVRLAQGDAAQSEQLARRALSYASGRATLQASLWELIAKARERQGDAAGAAQARQRAQAPS